MTAKPGHEPGLPPVIRLRPCFKDYAWGDAEFIRAVTGAADAPTPCAEAWFGAHEGGPARCAESGLALSEIVAAHGAALLGPRVQAAFGGLPYLLKLLSAACPLSIQAHPDAERAAARHAAEAAAGLPEAERNYRDARPKPELIVALTPFSALCGFRPLDAIAQDLAPLAEHLGPLPEDGEALRGFLHRWFELDPQRVEAVYAALLDGAGAADRRAHRARRARTTLVEAAVAAARNAGEDEASRRRAAELDRGLLFFWLLEHVELAPGEAMYLGAGVPHAYLEGAGIEVMANSDNVLRAGLTAKRVDPQELLAVVRCDAGGPEVLRPAGDPSGAYATPAREFELHRQSLDGAPVTGVADGPETLLVLADGPVTLTLRCDDHETTLEAGGAALVPHGRRWHLAGGPATVWRVRVPDHD
jgi:mannose-6-phosphate isomerase class I